MAAYNLFRRKGHETLCCAVPEEFAIPSFLVEANWAFAGKIAAGAPPALPGFDEAAARTVARLSGFYLFQEVPETRTQMNSGIAAATGIAPIRFGGRSK
jgi:hypothetical protein